MSSFSYLPLPFLLLTSTGLSNHYYGRSLRKASVTWWRITFPFRHHISFCYVCGTMFHIICIRDRNVSVASNSVAFSALQLLKGVKHKGSQSQAWQILMENLDLLMGLRHIEFGLVPAAVVHAVVEKLTRLEVFKAEHITLFTDIYSEQMWLVHLHTMFT